jgi:hypothetical protein
MEKVKLLGRRELIAYCVTAVFCAGFLMGKIPADDFSKVMLMIISFYFGMRAGERGSERGGESGGPSPEGSARSGAPVT